MDIDRVLRAMRESQVFTEVWAWGGQGDDVYKDKPWLHMNPYKICGRGRGQNKNIHWEVGVTDNKITGEPQSPPGVWLYVAV